MNELINPLAPNKPSFYGPKSYASNDVKTEFASLFYKELLKQGLGEGFLGGEGPYAGMARDQFIEQMAKSLAEKNMDLLSRIK